MVGNLDNKARADAEAAVEKYKMQEMKVNMRILDTMKTQLPKQMRAVIQNAILAFREGKVSKAEISKLLDHEFPDQFFMSLLRCV